MEVSGVSAVARTAAAIVRSSPRVVPYVAAVRRFVLTRGLTKLEPGNTLATFTTVLGSPYAIRRQAVSNSDLHRISHHFRGKDVSAVVVTREDGVEVLWYRIQRAARGYRPTLTLTPHMGPEPLTITLGRTTFLDLKQRGLESSGVDWYLGAQTVHYRERWYFGRPGGYRHYILDAAVKIGDAAIAFMRTQSEPSEANIQPSCLVPDEVRCATTVEAYTVVAFEGLNDIRAWATEIPAEVG